MSENHSKGMKITPKRVKITSKSDFHFWVGTHRGTAQNKIAVPLLASHKSEIHSLKVIFTLFGVIFTRFGIIFTPLRVIFTG